MKKTTLVFCFTLSLYSYADMDKICLVTVEPGPTNQQVEYGIKSCQRNNILHVWFSHKYLEVHGEYPAKDHGILIQSQYCRFDRNAGWHGQRFTCVLYDNKPREFK